MKKTNLKILMNGSKIPETSQWPIPVKIVLSSISHKFKITLSIFLPFLSPRPAHLHPITLVPPLYRSAASKSSPNLQHLLANRSLQSFIVPDVDIRTETFCDRCLDSCLYYICRIIALHLPYKVWSVIGYPRSRWSKYLYIT